MLKNLAKAPFPWFGGKAKAAPAVWAALGDPDHYVEPFAGSLAVLLNRPHLANRPYRSETVNDIDGLLVNAWRSIQIHPDATAEAASNPVAEADLHARHLALVRWREQHQLEHLMGDPGWCCPEMAGWWLWGICCWIGSGWCSGRGAWTADETGRLVRRKDLPGVTRQLPHLGNDGQGVNHAGTREPGVYRKLPHINDDGHGVNRPGTREPGVTRKRPHITDDGRGVNRPGTREPGTGEPEFHPVTMPELTRWFRWLQARLRHVRILNGDYRRTLTSGATKTLSVRKKSGNYCGVFLDPPYADTANRTSDLYSHDDESIAHEVAQWAVQNGQDPSYRIVMAGFRGEHDDLFNNAGWTEVEWFGSGYLQGGMGNTSKSSQHQQDRERLWCSPHCQTKKKPGLWGDRRSED